MTDTTNSPDRYFRLKGAPVGPVRLGLYLDGSTLNDGDGIESIQFESIREPRATVYSIIEAIDSVPSLELSKRKTFDMSLD